MYLAVTGSGSGTPRDTAVLRRFFDGFELVYPGITDVAEWNPAVKPQAMPGLRIIGGVGEKAS